MTLTCATPSRIDRRVASRLRAYWSTLEMGKVLDQRLMKNIGGDEGFTLRKVGGIGIAFGSRRSTEEIPDWTSWAALSMFRSNRNCRMMLEEPCVLEEVMLSRPRTEANEFSSGVATAVAMVCGSAPGRLAETLMVGKSMFGNSLTGSRK